MPQAALREPYDSTIPLPNAEPSVQVEEVGSVWMLIKSPQSFARLVAQDRFDVQPSMVLMATALGFYSLYGLAMGCFTGGNSLWQATLKAPMILMGSIALTAPGLYLLLCLSGVLMSFRQVFAMLSGLAGASSVVMVGFAPVAWIFGVSTSNLQFMIGLHTVAWGVGLGCGLRLMSQAVPGGFRECKAMIAWAVMFMAVNAQMLTFFRPVLSVTPTKEFREGKRQFFLGHFYSSMAGEQPGAPSAPVIPEAAPSLPAESNKIPPPSVMPMSN